MHRLTVLLSSFVLLVGLGIMFFLTHP